MRLLLLALTALGSAVMVYGFWLAWEPLGFIIGGGAATALGLLLRFGEDQ